VPLRPIVSTTGSHTHALGRYLSSNSKKFVGYTPSFIKDFSDFICKAKDIHVDDHDIIFRFDIVSLFESPISEAIDMISKLVGSQTLNLVKLCLSSTFFSYKVTIYGQTGGTTMGSYLSHAVANIFNTLRLKL